MPTYYDSEDVLISYIFSKSSENTHTNTHDVYYSLNTTRLYVVLFINIILYCKKKTHKIQ